MSPYQVMLRKDVRRLALPLALWVVLLIAYTYFDVTSSPVSHQAGTFAAMWQLWKTLDVILYWVFTVFISAAVVLEDSPKGTEAFWLTRPYPQGSVLAAKLTILGFLIVAPLAACAIYLVSTNVGPVDAAIVTVSALLELGITPLAAAVIAATSDSFGKFALTAILLLVGSVTVLMTTGALVFFVFATAGYRHHAAYHLS